MSNGLSLNQEPQQTRRERRGRVSVVAVHAVEGVTDTKDRGWSVTRNVEERTKKETEGEEIERSREEKWMDGRKD